jgi:GWxTD domain-containing protein
MDHARRIALLGTAGLAAAVGLAAPAARAQGPNRADGHRLVAEALLLAERGDTAGALERAERATRVAPDLADARFLYGLLLSRTSTTAIGSYGRRVDAANELEAALRLDAGNPRYLIEVARLRLKTPMLRIQAERLFRRALDAAHRGGDPALIAEIEAEIGAIYLRRYQAQAHRRIVLGAVQGFDWESALRDPHYTRDLLLSYSTEVPGVGETDLARAEARFRAGVAAAPASDAANRGLLALLAETGREEELRDAARRFARAAPDNGSAWLVLGMALWWAGRAPAAESAFGRALALLPPAERAPLEDLSTVLRAAETVAYRSLDDSTRRAFERTYWWAAEPLRLTPENEARLEHLARVALAELLFGAPDLRLRGWLTDRGQLLIRYGPPPVLATFAPEPAENGDDLMLTGAVTTVWYYPETNLRFVFAGPPAFNFARLAGDFGSYAENARFVRPAAYDNLAVARALDTIRVQTAQFRPVDDSGGTEVVFFAGIPVRRMAEGVELDAGELETGWFLSDASGRDVLARRGNETVRYGAEQQFETRTHATRLTPGDYLYRIEARLPAGARAARALDRFTVDTLAIDRLALSDVVVADRVAPRDEGRRPRGRRDFFIDPNASMTFHGGEPVHLLAEAYGLSTRDTIGGPAVRFQVSVRLRITAVQRQGLAARVVGGMLDALGASAKGDDQVVLQYVAAEPLDDRDRIPIYLALDLSGAPAGQYQLDLAVTDLETGAVATRRRVLQVVEAAP